MLTLLLQKSMRKINSEIEPNKDQSTEFQEKFDLVKQIEELFQPYRSNKSELSDTERLKEVLLG